MKNKEEKGKEEEGLLLPLKIKATRRHVVHSTKGDSPAMRERHVVHQKPTQLARERQGSRADDRHPKGHVVCS